MADVVTISSKGQVVIPAKIRGEMGIEKSDKFIIVHDRDTILLKRVRDSDYRNRLKKLLDKFSDEFEKNKITESDVEDAIRELRSKGA